MRIKGNGKIIEARLGDVVVRASISFSVVRGVIVPVVTFADPPKDPRAQTLMARMMRKIGVLHVKRPGRRPTPAGDVGENRLHTLGRLQALPKLPRL